MNALAEDVDMDNSGGDTVPGVAAGPAVSADLVAAAASAVNPAPVVAKKRRKSHRLENLGIPVEELLKQQQELFAKVYFTQGCFCRTCRRQS